MMRAGRFGRILAMALALGAASNARAGEGEAWSVSKSSGEVWMTATGAQQVSLGQQDVLKPGDTIRTGRNGRVMLVRGEETMLVSPNSVVGLPTEKKDGLSTTIVQQAGSILLEVEKRNVKHFEVETPYLAAVVKGTQFRISVDAASTRIDVIRGQVEVADFRSGQIAQVMPGQVATAFAQGKPGLSLSGTGAFSPIEQGRPRASTIPQIMVPKSGLSAPHHAANGQFNHALGHGDAGAARHGVTRISASLGEVRLNFHKVTHGLAHGGDSTPGTARNVADKDTVWASHEAGTTTPSAASGTSGGSSGSSSGNSSGGNSGSSSSGNSGSSYGSSSGNASIANVVNVATGVTAGTISGVTGTVTGVTGNNGNGNGNGNGNNNGANGNGNNDNGNGNGNGHGNGHAYGHYK
jgi:FecR protein